VEVVVLDTFVPCTHLGLHKHPSNPCPLLRALLEEGRCPLHAPGTQSAHAPFQSLPLKAPSMGPLRGRPPCNARMMKVHASVLPTLLCSLLWQGPGRPDSRCCFRAHTELSGWPNLHLHNQPGGSQSNTRLGPVAAHQPLAARAVPNHTP